MSWGFASPGASARARSSASSGMRSSRTSAPGRFASTISTASRCCCHPAWARSRTLALSYLAGAYMRHEVLPDVPLAIYTLNAAIEDKPLPYESLRATAPGRSAISTRRSSCRTGACRAFRAGEKVAVEPELRGDFGSYLVADAVELEPGGDTAGSPSPTRPWTTLGSSCCETGSRSPTCSRPSSARPSLPIGRACAGWSPRPTGCSRRPTRRPPSTTSAAFSSTACAAGPSSTRTGSRGAISRRFLRAQNAPLHAAPLRAGWPLCRRRSRSTRSEAPRKPRAMPSSSGCAASYLPLMYSRRHGDPSRPWNRFSIRRHGRGRAAGLRLPGQLARHLPELGDPGPELPRLPRADAGVFLNASTADGYNPYRISRDGGIDWEVADPDDPWGHFGYWGDHQIVYLLRLLESEERFRPGALARWLNRREYSYANVPYRIAGLDATLAEPHEHHHLRRGDASADSWPRPPRSGADAKLVADSNGDVLLVSLAEKLLVPLLVKLTNFVPDGGTWLNAQRPEWNDANNALAGWGLSMVTVAHARRYLRFCERVFVGSEPVELSEPVARPARAPDGDLRRRSREVRRRRAIRVPRGGRTGRRGAPPRGLCRRAGDPAIRARGRPA